MKTSVQSVGPAFDAPVASTAGGSSTGFSNDHSRAEAERQAQYRLVIEKGPGAGFIYKTLDRVTGEIVKQFPRDEVIKLQESADYSAGRVIDTRI